MLTEEKVKEGNGSTLAGVLFVMVVAGLLCGGLGFEIGRQQAAEDNAELLEELDVLKKSAILLGYGSYTDDGRFGWILTPELQEKIRPEKKEKESE